MERIEKLRKRALEPERFDADIEFYTLFYKEYEQNSDLSEELRYAEAFYYAFTNLTPQISDGELIVGSRDVPVSNEIRTAWDKKYKVNAFKCREPYFCGQDSHMAIDYELIMKKGLNGIIAQINQYLKECDSDKERFYISCKRCLEAVIKHSESYADLALKMSETCTDELRSNELKMIAEICKRVPAEPPQSFYEAVQATHFVTYCLSFNPFRMVNQQFQLGHPDRYLFHFYERDIKDKIITKEFAQLLLDCLGIQINMRVSNGLSSGYMVGGRDKNGEIVANDLTDMCMQVIEDIRLVYPAVGFCYTNGMPEEYLEKACDMVLKGYTHPAIFNDDVISKGLIYYGVPKEQAHDYIHSTCVEITPVASSNVWVASPYTNMPQLLLDVMDCEYSSFDELMNKYLEVLDAQIKINFENEMRNREIRKKGTINPLLSCFVNDCLARGMDIECGGARYNWIMPSFVGMANLVDSLYVLKTLIFDEKTFTISEIKAIANNDFECDEELRLHILNNIPKYGNDIDDIDMLYGIITEHITEECEKYIGLHDNAQLIPSVFCWIMHEQFGKITSATPDGRKAGFPLGDGSGPCQGREMNGPTASILSSTKWNHSKFIGGVAVNLKFAKSSLGVSALNNMKALIKTYLKRGGFEVQVNVVDNDTLRRAQKNPEAYRDLVVRIGGYSDYFVRLSREMQEEVIIRSAHEIQ